MPEFDGTGPEGKAPMTGRGSGYCAISLNTSQEELGFLTEQLQVLQQQLKTIELRINQIKNN